MVGNTNLQEQEIVIKNVAESAPHGVGSKPDSALRAGELFLHTTIIPSARTLFMSYHNTKRRR